MLIASLGKLKAYAVHGGQSLSLRRIVYARPLLGIQQFDFAMLLWLGRGARVSVEGCDYLHTDSGGKAVMLQQIYCPAMIVFSQVFSQLFVFRLQDCESALWISVYQALVYHVLRTSAACSGLQSVLLYCLLETLAEAASRLLQEVVILAGPFVRMLLLLGAHILWLFLVGCHHSW